MKSNGAIDLLLFFSIHFLSFSYPFLLLILQSLLSKILQHRNQDKIV